MGWVCGYAIGGRISDGFEFGLVFGVGFKPAAVLRLLWYRLGLFMYSWSSFFRREYASLRLALFMITAMALWHRAGISSSSGGSGSCKTSLACVLVCMLCVKSVVICVSDFGLGSMLFAVFLSRVMRFSYLVSDFVIGGCSFVAVSFEVGWVIGHIVWASRW